MLKHYAQAVYLFYLFAILPARRGPNQESYQYDRSAMCTLFLRSKQKQNAVSFFTPGALYHKPWRLLSPKK